MSGFDALQRRFDAMQPRERLLISLTFGVLLVVFLYVVWVEPASKTAASNAGQIEVLAPQVESGRAAMARLQDEIARDPEAARRLALDRLEQEAGELDGRLGEDRAAVIPPGRMPGVLRELLGRDARLSVLGVQALPPDVLRWSPAEPAAMVEGVPSLYRHRVVLRFQGDYAAALDYVRAVEALPYRVRLDELEVDAERWPRLEITLTVETLGLGEGWIGV